MHMSIKFNGFFKMPTGILSKYKRCLRVWMWSKHGKEQKIDLIAQFLWETLF